MRRCPLRLGRVTAAILAIGLSASVHRASAQSLAAGSSDASAIYRGSAGSVFLVEVRGDTSAIGFGSAFLIGGGRLVTNAHVIRGGKPFLKTGAVALPLAVQRIDAAHDLAILYTDTPLEATPLRLANAEPAIGTSIYALGNPQGLERSISEGIVSGVRVRDGRRLLQITAAISPGSSGGPVLTKDGAVVGVTVGYLEGGQNLNFVIPASFVAALLSSSNATGDYAVAVDYFRQVLASTEDSSDPSAWERRSARERNALRAAATHATTARQFIELAVLADSAAESTLSVEYAREAMRRDRTLTDSARAVMLAAWQFDVRYADSTDAATIRTMLAVADSQIVHRQNDPEAYNFRAEALAKLQRGAAAIAAARRAVELGEHHDRIGVYWTTYHRLAGGFGTAADDEAVFAALVKSGGDDIFDWNAHARHLEGRQLWGRAADLYAEASRRFSRPPLSSTSAMCSAGRLYWVDDQADRALEALRNCVSRYATAARIDTAEVAVALRSIASILNDRGVYATAESHARQSLTLWPHNPWAAYELSRALEEQQRPTEAAAAAEEAIRMSDGKYGSFHFAAGSAYFDLKNWSRCAQAFTKAAELNPKDAPAAYNAGLCLARQGYYRDAAQMMSSVLVRDPNRSDRADIQRWIAEWRR